MSPGVRLVILGWPPAGGALRARVAEELGTLGATPIGADVFRVRASEERLLALRALLEELRLEGGDALLADLTED